MSDVKATQRYLHGSKQTNEFIKRQNDDESDDAETAPDFLEGDIAIPEVN